MRHNGVTIFCPHHGYPLRAAGWKDKLDDSRTDPRNPRLIYDLNGNLILVQVYYECSLLLPGSEKPGQRYLSASTKVMAQLPSHVVRLFLIILQQRCGVTFCLYDHVITGIYQDNIFWSYQRA